MYIVMFIIFYVFPSLFSSIGFIGIGHSSDHFEGYDEHTMNNNNNNNNNQFNRVINNFNVAGGIVSSVRSISSQFHLTHKNLH